MRRLPLSNLLRLKEIAVYDQEFDFPLGNRAVGTEIIGNNIGHALPEDVFLTVFVLGDELPFKTVDDVAFPAPVVSKISGGIGHDPDSQSRELNRFPKRGAGFSGVLDVLDPAPIDYLKRDVVVSHDQDPLD
jgi:hypothetical protein